MQATATKYATGIEAQYTKFPYIYPKILLKTWPVYLMRKNFEWK